VVLITFCGGV
jgi:large subunit ribosomal protein L24e